MSKDDILAQLTQFHKSASAELAQMQRRVRLFESDYSDECNDCWSDGYEEALEPFENLVDDLGKLLKSVEISNTMDHAIEVSEKQKPLL